MIKVEFTIVKFVKSYRDPCDPHLSRASACFPTAECEALTWHIKVLSVLQFFGD